MAHDLPNPTSPGGRPVLTVDEFTRTMDTRTEMIDAKFDQTHTLIKSGFENIQNQLTEIVRRQTEANGRLGKAETGIQDVKTNGCAQFEAHQALIGSRPQGWGKREKAIAIGGGAGVGAVLFDLIQIIKHAMGI